MRSASVITASAAASGPAGLSENVQGAVVRAGVYRRLRARFGLSPELRNGSGLSALSSASRPSSPGNRADSPAVGFRVCSTPRGGLEPLTPNRNLARTGANAFGASIPGAQVVIGRLTDIKSESGMRLVVLRGPVCQLCGSPWLRVQWTCCLGGGLYLVSRPGFTQPILTFRNLSDCTH